MYISVDKILKYHFIIIGFLISTVILAQSRQDVELANEYYFSGEVEKALVLYKDLAKSKSIVPEIKTGKRVLIVAHGNSLRALVKHLDGISDDEISKLNIPTGVPLVYELDSDLKPVKSYYLGDEKAAAEKAAAVANQAKA